MKLQIPFPAFLINFLILDSWFPDSFVLSGSIRTTLNPLPAFLIYFFLDSWFPDSSCPIGLDVKHGGSAAPSGDVNKCGFAA